MWGELETEQNCNILTLTLLAITAFHSRSPGLLNRRPAGPASAGTWFSFQHLLSNCWLPVAPGLYNYLTSTCLLWASQFTLKSTRRQSMLSPDIFDRMHLLFTQVHFLFWQLGRGPIFNNRLHLCSGVRPHPSECLDMTLNHLVVRLQPWNFEEYGVPPSLPLLPSKLSPGVVTLDRILSIR